MAIGNEEKVDQAGSLDLNLDVTSGENENCVADNHHIKGVPVGKKECYSEARKEQDNVDFSSCSRDVCNSCTFGGGKYEVDLQMDSDSRKQLNFLFKEEVIDTTNTRFKSRVKFFSILDPTRICSYISEVVDAGFLGPLFKVTMEDCPSEAFTDTSAEKCWESVLKRLNHEIMRRGSLGELELPPLEFLKSINGLRMFGFLLPSIIQAIEAQDPSHQCVEYWNHKVVPTSSGSVISDFKVTNGSSSSLDNVDTKGFDNNLIEQAKDNIGGSCRSLEEMKPILERASSDELSTMLKLLSSDAQCSQWRMALLSLMDETQKACR
ncbi:FY-rich, C-terminal [Sesbania bispinosa]|nr:FY-rich, C-terminal [Sesbania bispinosa]